MQMSIFARYILLHFIQLIKTESKLQRMDLMKKLGLIINPIAGMGGSVGLKGTDGVLDEAIKRGAVSHALEKAHIALERLTHLKNNMLVVTCSDKMGEDAAKSLGFKTKIVYRHDLERTTSLDTVNAARLLLHENVDLLLFVGGDGTARDIYNGVLENIICLGIPAGVKIHSPVFAQSPFKAGEIAKLFVEGKTTLTKEVEVIDIDEDEYRRGNVNTMLYGYLNVPVERHLMQNKKSPSPLSQKSQQYAIADEVIKEMEPDTYYIIGPGSTTRAVMEVLDLKNTLIGVDIILNKKLVANDLTEEQILNYISQKPSKLIITPTGGQGFLLGRGNQQISSQVIKKLGKKNIIVISTKEKISNLQGEPLLVDTGSEETDNMIKGYIKIITGYKEAVMYKIK